MGLQRVRYAVGAAVIIGIIAAVFLFRDTPRYFAPEPQEPAATGPSLNEVPSKENVSPSFTAQVEQLKRSVEAQPTNAPHLLTLARLLMDAHRHADAIRYLEQAERLRPKDDSLLLDMAVSYAALQEYPKAMKATERILARDPDQPRALLNKGALHATQRQEREARAAWERLIRLHPGSEEAATAARYRAQMEKR